MSNGEKHVPTIHLSSNAFSYLSDKTVHGFKELLRILEEGTYEEDINVISTCNIIYLSSSMYPVAEGMSPYQTLCKREPGIAANTKEKNGTAEQWQMLSSELQKAGNLSALCVKKLCSVQELHDGFGDYLSADKDTRFLCFINLKVFYSRGSDYLAYCLNTANTSDELEAAIYNAILEVDHQSDKFLAWKNQRRGILKSLDVNSAFMKDYCERATIKGKNILWYLSDDTEEERAALLHALSCYSYTPDELNDMLSVASKNLHTYFRQFTFDEYNTKVMESDAYVHPLLTDYFQKYKLQKLTNQVDSDFIKHVEKEAIDRSFTRLQSRSQIIQKIDKKNAQPYFFDALGVEFLSFIQSKADEYGLQFESYIGHCNLPSITSKNKEFYNVFPEGSLFKEEGLDELKHRGTKYDFQFTPEPMHIFDELELLDKDLRKIRSVIDGDKIQRIIILSDHGASRLAVIYKSENEKLELPEPGQHSGRCCPVDEDPGIPFATYEDGYAVLANYERFKGSRKADVETHGGASLEEVLVPVIVLTQKPKERRIFFVEDVVPCSPKDGAKIQLYSNPPLKNPRMTVGEKTYTGQFEGDKHNVIFDLPDIRRKGTYEAIIYDGGARVATLTFETVRPTKTKDFF